MSKLWVGIISGAAGVAVGLWLAKQYAQNTVSSDIHNVLNSIGLGGGRVENITKAIILPQVS